MGCRGRTGSGRRLIRGELDEWQGRSGDRPRVRAPAGGPVAPTWARAPGDGLGHRRGGRHRDGREERGGGRHPAFLRYDVIDEAQVEAHVDATVPAFGKLAFAGNNAGPDGVIAPISDMDSAVRDRVMKVRLYSVFHC
ncbi:SDR family oxidoreductase [Streptomyces olivaceoviridis]|uniref:SDR family oxidoreductase n=1 Tax=Streptomyces olivaceoviridis TaxID=1921 RepID=UPI0033A8A95F